MKANELRIGNLVTTIDRNNKIHLSTNIIESIGGISLFSVDLYDYKKPFYKQQSSRDCNVSDLEPIPLTEDWLLKFGFKNSYVSIGDLTLSCMDNIYYLSDEYENGFNLPDIQYVHQLQNLYFALTQKELVLLNK